MHMQTLTTTEDPQNSNTFILIISSSAGREVGIKVSVLSPEDFTLQRRLS